MVCFKYISHFNNGKRLGQIFFFFKKIIELFLLCTVLLLSTYVLFFFAFSCWWRFFLEKCLCFCCSFLWHFLNLWDLLLLLLSYFLFRPLKNSMFWEKKGANETPVWKQGLVAVTFIRRSFSYLFKLGSTLARQKPSCCLRSQTSSGMLCEQWKHIKTETGPKQNHLFGSFVKLLWIPRDVLQFNQITVIKKKVLLHNKNTALYCNYYIHIHKGRMVLSNLRVRVSSMDAWLSIISL